MTKNSQELSPPFTEPWTYEKLLALFAETDRKIDKLRNEFSDSWGDLVQSLVSGDLLKLLKARGIKVKRTTENFAGCVDGDNFEFDILAINNTELVVVEVKTTLRVVDVKNFLKKLRNIRKYLPEYGAMNIYGAMAYLKAKASSEIMAQSKGLFVIRATGSSSAIINEKDFVPRTF